jgi:D-sedoheptulose 7-phosphate isomerase
MNIESNIDVIISNFNELKKSASDIENIAKLCIKAIEKGNKILLCGNGGSASDAQHIAAELVVKYKKIRRAIPAIALTTDTSIMTAVGNDISAEKIFERQVEALGMKGDILIAISTSGNSINIINALNMAKQRGVFTILFTGKDGGIASQISDFVLNVPSNITNNIQELHIASGHLICDLIEEHFSK